MPRQAKGPRLVLLKGRRDNRSGKPLPDIWFIRNGEVKRSTGFVDDGTGRPPEDAIRALGEYIATEWAPKIAAQQPAASRSDPAQVYVAEVLDLYLKEKAPRTADPVSVGGRLAALSAWWGEKTLDEIRRSTCEAYIRFRTTQHRKACKTAVRFITEQGARRELEDLSAAIGWWHGEHKLYPRPEVYKARRRETPRDALSRSEAAAILLAAMGWRRAPNGSWSRVRGCTVANRRHLRRFVLISLYTGSRSGVTKSLLWSESVKQAWVDLEKGWVYRRGKQEQEIRTKRRPLVKMPRRLRAHMRRWARLDSDMNERRRKEGLDPIVSVLHHGGDPIGSVRTGFAGLVADAGLNPEITPHWLRHTAATWLMEADTPIWDAAAYMGMSSKTLEDHYGHHRPNHQSDTAAKAGRGGR